MRVFFGKVLARLGATARRQLGQEAFLSLAHVAFLLGLVALLRPMFFRLVGDEHYRAPFIFESMVKSDLGVIAQAAHSHQPAVPEVLSFVVIGLVFLLSKRRLRWTDWEHGEALRIFVLLIVFMLAWSGATFPFNNYLNRGHFGDRAMLVGFAALSWRYPIFVPFAVRSAIVLIKEAYTPIALDDFDFRAPAEMAVIFSVFVWASISRSFKPAHFLLAGVGSWASYYFAAGVAKWGFGPKYSWLLENHVSNISVSSYVRGWASFIPEKAFMAFAEFARKLDQPLQGFTLLIELGSIVAFFIDRRVTRWWFLGCFILNFGIFMMTGICFWKWMTVSLGAFIWMSRSGKPLIARFHEYKLPVLLVVASVYYGNLRIWYNPQTHVVWYDTRLEEDYELYAIGVSGTRYLVPPTFFEPMDMHWTQGRLCYDADEGHSTTGIYGTTGSYPLMKSLENQKTPSGGLNRVGGDCTDIKQQERDDAFMKIFFGNINRYGLQHSWLKWIARPRHLWVFPEGELRERDKPLNPYKGQEKIAEVELWLTVVYHHDTALYRTEPELEHTVEIPH